MRGLESSMASALSLSAGCSMQLTVHVAKAGVHVQDLLDEPLAVHHQRHPHQRIHCW